MVLLWTAIQQMMMMMKSGLYGTLALDGWRENRTLIDLLLHMYRRDIVGEQGEDPSTAEWSFFICHHNNNH